MPTIQCPIGFPVVYSSDEPPVRYAAKELSRYLERIDGEHHQQCDSFEGFCVRLQCGAAALEDDAFRISINTKGILMEPTHFWNAWAATFLPATAS